MFSSLAKITPEFIAEHVEKRFPMVDYIEEIHGVLQYETQMADFNMQQVAQFIHQYFGDHIKVQTKNVTRYYTFVPKKVELVIQEAIRMLEPYDKENVSTFTCYFENDDYEAFESEYDTCADEECVKKSKRMLQKRYKDVHVRYHHNDGDHERFETCSQCGRYLNNHLTWIRSELEHHIQYTRTKDELTKSHNVFEISCIFCSFPGSDYKVSEYSKHQEYLGNDEPILSDIRHQKEHINKVFEYAQHVIKMLQ
jgi:hypothetical protein